MKTYQQTWLYFQDEARKFKKHPPNTCHSSKENLDKVNSKLYY